MQWAQYALPVTVIFLWQALNQNSYNHIQKKKLMFLQFNDDLFMRGNDTKKELFKFINELN